MRAREVISLAFAGERSDASDTAADEILAAVYASGYVIVPRKPTEAMLEAGYASVLPATPENVYQAMIVAAKQDEGSDEG